MFSGGSPGCEQPPAVPQGLCGTFPPRPTTMEGQLHGGRALDLSPAAIGQRFSRSVTRLVRSPQWEGPLV